MKDILKSLSEISPYVRRAWDGYMIPGWKLKERVIFDYEIVYIMEGNAIITIEDRHYNAETGEVYLFRPGVRHSMHIPKHFSLRQPHIHFDLYTQKNSDNIPICYRPIEKIRAEEMKYFKEDVTQTQLLTLPERIKLKNKNIVEKLLFEIIRDQEKPDSYTFLRSKAYFIQLLVQLLSEVYGGENPMDSVTSSCYEKINPIGEYIRLNYHLNLDLNQLAKKAGISKSHFLRLFKQVYKTSPIQYQMNFKIERAKQMISTCQNTITEIAQYLGFTDVQHFSRTFKRRTGLSPMAYRSNSDIIEHKISDWSICR